MKRAALGDVPCTVPAPYLGLASPDPWPHNRYPASVALITERIPRQVRGRTRAIIAEKAVRDLPRNLLLATRAAAASASHRLTAQKGASGATPRAALYCVYRHNNTAHVATLIRQLGDGIDVHLHALDQAHPTLQAKTWSAGPGQRMELLARLVAGHPPADDAWVVIADDDVTFRWDADGRRFRSLAQFAGFNLAQPAHFPGSNHVYRLNAQHLVSIARTTHYVEVGPLLIASPSALEGMLPFPDDVGMGWGLDIEWSHLGGLRLGVVDATPILHHGTVSSAYSASHEQEILDRYLVRHGLEDVRSFVDGRSGVAWRPWQSRPPWAPE